MADHKDYTVKTFDKDGTELSSNTHQWETTDESLEQNAKDMLRQKVEATKITIADGDDEVAVFEKGDDGVVTKSEA